MLGWNLCLQCSSLVFEEKIIYFIGFFFNSSGIRLFSISYFVPFVSGGLAAQCFPRQWQADMAGRVTLNAVPGMQG